MLNKPSHLIGRAETRAARTADRKRGAEAAWKEVTEQQRVQDEKTARLKALRLAAKVKE